jgi:pimeloyl-ACP methyl ester carboxylesterase
MLLSHRDLGGAGLPPLVVLHGLLGSSRNWQTAGTELARSFHVLAVDLRNHGASFHSDAMGWGAMLDDLTAWMDSAAPDPAAVMGHSLGGKVAMLLACRHPARVTRLVVVDVAPRNYDWPERRLEIAALEGIDLSRLASRAEAERLIESRVPGWAIRKFLLTNLERVPEGGWRWIVNLPALRGALSELQENPLKPGDRFPGPSLFIAGGKSAFLQDGDRIPIACHFPAAEFEVFAESGHNPHMDAREELVRSVRTFLTRA